MHAVAMIAINRIRYGGRPHHTCCPEDLELSYVLLLDAIDVS